MKVQSPDGRSWRVRRRWLPWRRRLRGGWDVPSIEFGDDPISLILFIVIGIPAAVIFLLWGIEFAVVLLLLPFALAARRWFGRHWYVEVWCQKKFVEDVAGGTFDSSGQLLLRLAREIETGERFSDS